VNGGARAFVLGITADLAFAAGALLASIRAQDPDCDATVVILHDGLDAGDLAAFQRIWPGCRFRLFGCDAAVARLGKAGERVAGFLKQYSPMVLAKLELPDLLEEFERVVWLDADILVQGPLDPLWAFDCLAWRGLPSGAFKRRERALGLFGELELDPRVPLLNGGVIGVSRRFLDLGGSTALLQDHARRLAEGAPASQIDELPWYLAAAARGMPVEALPMALNHPVGATGAKAAVVVHAIGAHKFWNATPLLQLYPDWSRHQATWVAGGGRAYDGPVAMGEVHPLDPSETLRAAQMRDYWLALFRDLRPVLPRGMVVDLQHDRPQLRIFLHGRPEGEHLSLKRLPKAGRVGLDPVLPGPLRDRVVDAICRDVRGWKLDRGTISLPVGQLGGALAVVETVLSAP
jgi:hypothetical protein